MLFEKTFIPLISPKQIQEAVIQLGVQINRDYNGKNPVLLGILNGSFIFLADLARCLDCKPEFGFLGLSSYGNETKSKGEVIENFQLNINLEGRHVLVVEDIVDHGLTLKKIKEKLNTVNPASLKVASLLFKPKAFLGNEKPDYVGFEIGNEFVVGYGLDFAGKGRELPGIYQCKE